MADTKPHPEQQIREIHAIFNEDDLADDEIIKRIRAVLYGEEEDEEDEDDGQEK